MSELPQPTDTFYTPQWELVHYGIRTCAHCGQLPLLHHSDQRCYTDSELVARLEEYQRTNHWPPQDFPSR